jgi:hypothetical protein
MRMRFQVLMAASMKMTVFWEVSRVFWYKFTVISKVLTTSIISEIMETVSASETSVSFYQMTVIFMD